MTDIQKIYHDDPLNLNKQDLDETVRDLQMKRHAFNRAAIPAKSPNRTKKDPGPDVGFEL